MQKYSYHPVCVCACMRACVSITNKHIFVKCGKFVVPLSKLEEKYVFDAMTLVQW